MAIREKYKEEVKLTFYNNTFTKIGTLYLEGWKTVDMLLEKFYIDLDYYEYIITSEGVEIQEEDIKYIEIDDGY
ncbi:hypothetical protein CHOTACABRAS_106 [Bacillus phage Chotacabras]|nr:hypothetical protein CHOTACABRAS_106 [Bacillus phage Chotacabras]